MALQKVTLTLTRVLDLHEEAMAGNSVYKFSMDSLEGKPVSLGVYRGKVLLIVNVATF